MLNTDITDDTDDTDYIDDTDYTDDTDGTDDTDDTDNTEETDDRDYTDYIVVQQTTTVSLTGLPVLRTLYKPISMHKQSKLTILCFIKVLAFK